MAAAPLMRSLSTRAVKKVDKPRPRKSSPSHPKSPNEPASRLPLQELMMLVEYVSQSLLDKNFEESEACTPLRTKIVTMHSKLKIHGEQLETIFKDQLDRAFAIFRHACQDEKLNYTLKCLLLELVELRANQWATCDTAESYYSAKMSTSEIEPLFLPQTIDTLAISSPPSPVSPSAPVLSPGEVLKISGKFPKPTKIPGKNYCKDEVVIRNSDSGKVMGIKGRRVHMIEELSETIISFQRVNPGAKERLVQITGPSEENIIHARHLMEDTIHRNASPVREAHVRLSQEIRGSSSSLNSTASDESNLPAGSRRSLLHSFSTNDASLGEYKYTITLGQDTVKITGTNHEIVRNARLVLEEYYSVWVQKNCAGDCLLTDDDVFLNNGSNINMLDLDLPPLNSEDSGNGNGPSSSSGDSDDITCIGSVPTTPVTTLEPGLIYAACSAGPQHKKQPSLGRTNSSPISSPLSPETKVTRKYSRDFLVECAISPLSKVTPPDWDQIVAEFPGIAKKVGTPFDPKKLPKRTNWTIAVGTNKEPASDEDKEQ